MPNETHGARRRHQILTAAADLSTAVGLGSLSLSQIASEVGLTKPGVAAHFDSKEALQLETVEAVASEYAVWFGAASASSEPGLARLRAIAHAWLDYLERIPYRGGCFFAAAGHGFSGHPGPVRDALARYTRGLIRQLEEQARLASRLGELRGDVESDALAFSVHALAQDANLRRELLDDPNAFTLARRALDDLLQAAT